MATYLGLDVGGTKVAVGVVTGEGEVLARLRLPTAELRAGGDPLERLIALGREALREGGVRQPDGVGLALPGPVDRGDVRMLAAPTIPEFEGRPLTAPLGEAFGCPVAGDNDANAAAVAESRFGAGRGYPHVVYFTISTGIGGGIVVEGKVFRGASGTSAEFGHQVVVPAGGPACDCGGTGCLEALASGRGIATRARAAAHSASVTPEWGRREITAESVAEAARAGEPVARGVWEETALYLGFGIGNVINILDPSVVVLGGGVGTGAADLLLEGIRGVVARRCMPSLSRSVPIVTAGLGADLGILGAACLVWEFAER